MTFQQKQEKPSKLKEFQGFVINTHFRYFHGGYIGKSIEINIFSNIFSILFDKKNPSFQDLFHYSAEQFTALI